MKTFFVVTYGCQMNLHESEKLSGALREMGYEPAASAEEADVVVFNTCCIRENAERRAYGNIGKLKKLKRERPNMILAVGGCMTQQRGAAEKLKEKFPFVDIVFGTHNLGAFRSLLERRITGRKKIVEIADDDGKIVEDGAVYRTSYPNAWVNVMRGCDNFCSYCIVPYVRGREHSREEADILREVGRAVEEGYKEITLLGQNVNSYGKDLAGGADFADLLEKVAAVPGKFRLRFMTNHPKDLSERLVRVMAENEKICPTVHLPVQSGSDRILAAMNRRYTREKYFATVDMIRSLIPDCAVTTDIMVGFPTETEEEFRETLDLVRRVRFAGAFTFVYSPRSGTAAAKMDGQIAEEVKKDRIVRLVELQNSITEEYSAAYQGRTVEVLAEDFDEKGRFFLGRDAHGRMVHFTGRGLVGEFCSVLVTKTGGMTLTGERVE